MKALVLSGGAGTRLRPSTHLSAGPPVPVADKLSDKAVRRPGRALPGAAGITQVGAAAAETGARGGDGPEPVRDGRVRVTS